MWPSSSRDPRLPNVGSTVLFLLHSTVPWGASNPIFIIVIQEFVLPATDGTTRRQNLSPNSSTSHAHTFAHAFAPLPPSVYDWSDSRPFLPRASPPCTSNQSCSRSVVQRGSRGGAHSTPLPGAWLDDRGNTICTGAFRTPGSCS